MRYSVWAYRREQGWDCVRQPDISLCCFYIDRSWFSTWGTWGSLTEPRLCSHKVIEVCHDRATLLPGINECLYVSTGSYAQSGKIRAVHTARRCLSYTKPPRHNLSFSNQMKSFKGGWWQNPKRMYYQRNGKNWNPKGRHTIAMAMALKVL